MTSARATMDVLAADSEATGGRISAKGLLPEAQAAGSGGPGLVVDAVADAVLAAPSPPLPFEGFSNRYPYSTGVLCERANDKLDTGRSDRFGELLGQAPRRTPGHDDPVAHRDRW
jgi:hypothetical protein